MKQSRKKKTKQGLKNFVFTLGQVYLAFFVLWVILRFLVQDALWWTMLLNTYPFLVTVPALLFALVFWRFGKKIQAIAFFSLIIFMFVINYGALFWPNGAGAVENGRSFTIMTYNIQFDNGHEDDMIDAIRSADADIVGLQEVLLRHTNRLEAEFSEQYPHRLFAEPEFLTDVAILSKYPITEVKQFVLQPRRMSMHAVLDVDGEPLHLIVVHLTPNQLGSLDGQPLRLRLRERYTIRLTEVTGLLLELQNIDGPVVLLCDCNFSETSQAYRKLAAVLKEVHREIGWGFGKSNGNPAYQRVDYIWYSEGIEPLSYHFSERAASDHKPIFATMQFE